MSSLKNTLQGTGVAIVTPFKNNEEPDFDALGKLIDFQIDNKVEYIVTLGTTGEVPTLSKQEKKEIVKFTIDKVNERVPIVLGIGGNNTKEVIEQFDEFDMDKVTAVLSASPYYNKPSQEGIFQHYSALGKASPKPVILYNVPSRTGSNITAETTLKLAHEVENIGGIKEASGSIVQGMHILKECPEGFLVVSGDDHIAMPLIACGSRGVISVIANCAPGKFSNLIRHALSGDFSKAREIQSDLLPVMDLLFIENNPAGVKAFLHEMGLIENVLRLPLVPLSDKHREKASHYVGLCR